MRLAFQNDLQGAAPADESAWSLNLQRLAVENQVVCATPSSVYRPGLEPSDCRAYTECVASCEYEVVLAREEDGGYSVSVPRLRGCASQGETREHALAMIREAIELYLESVEAHGGPVPGPIEIGRVTVSA